MLAGRHIDPVTDCWEWMRSKDSQGYGVISYKGQLYRIHRASAYLYFGFNLDSPLDVLHRCDNPPCFNPEHLFVGTASDNMKDASSKGRLRPSFGEANSRAKLTTDQVIQIRQMRNNGFQLKDIASEFGISISTVYGICARTNWSHLPDPPLTL